nr:MULTISPECIES: signal peptidase I [Myxococcaceae]
MVLNYGARAYVRYGLVEPWKVPAGSMEPALRVGDHFISDHRVGGERPPLAGLLFPGRQPERGEVIVFRHPGNPSQDLLKRVVALPGEVVALDADGLRIDGQPARGESLGACEETLAETVEDADCELYEETLGTHHYRVAYFFPSATGARLSSANCPVGTEPADGGCRVLPAHVFVLGDNRDNSFDSRHLGAVPLANVKAAARYIHFSMGQDWAVRWERIGTQVN